MKTRKDRVGAAAVCAGLAAAIAALAVWPAEATAAARDGLELCTDVIIPSLFPYFVLTSMLLDTGAAQALGRLAEPVMRPLFGVPGCCAGAVILGLLGGYPVGARSAAALLDSGRCTKAEAEKLLAFCNNSGPAFIFGVAGAAVFSSSGLAAVLYMSHAVSALAAGVLLRRAGGGGESGAAPAPPAPPREKRRGAAGFVGAVTDSFGSILNVCGFVIFFTVALRMLYVTRAMPAAAALLSRLVPIPGFDRAWGERLLTGALELSSGMWSLRGAAGTARAGAAAASFMLGWGGVSVHCQTLSVTAGRGLRMRLYFLGKLLHGCLSALATLAFTALFPGCLPAFAGCAVQSGAGSRVLRPAAAPALLACLACLAALALEKSGKCRYNKEKQAGKSFHGRRSHAVQKRD